MFNLFKKSKTQEIETLTKVRTVVVTFDSIDKAMAFSKEMYSRGTNVEMKTVDGCHVWNKSIIVVFEQEIANEAMFGSTFSQKFSRFGYTWLEVVPLG